MVTEKAISRELMGKIVDEVFDGAIEDASVIEEIYACIKRHEAALSTDAEPVAWYWEDATGCFHITLDRSDVVEMAKTVGCTPKPLFAGLCDTSRFFEQPAPSVVVKALRDLVEDLEMRAKNGVVDCSHGIYCAAKAALSAQVQDVPDLETRMKAAGMYTVAEMMGVTPLTKWKSNPAINTIESFSEWLDRKVSEYLSMKAGYDLGDKSEDDDLYEWVLAHAGVFSTIRDQFQVVTASLGVRVEDVAKTDDELFWRLRISYLRGAEWRHQTGSMELSEKASYDYADKITSPLVAAPAAKLEGKP